MVAEASAQTVREVLMWPVFLQLGSSVGLFLGWTGTELAGGICAWSLHHCRGNSYLENRGFYTLLDQQEMLSPLSTSFLCLGPLWKTIQLLSFDRAGCDQEIILKSDRWSAVRDRDIFKETLPSSWIQRETGNSTSQVFFFFFWVGTDIPFFNEHAWSLIFQKIA